jgi:hypothetical protein
VRFLACRRDGLVRRTIHRRPGGQFPARLIRRVISATAVFSCTVPSWSTAACQAVRRFRQGATEAELAVKLAKVLERLAVGASNMERPGGELIGHYLDPDRLPADRR